jgi:adenylate cyclase
VFGSRRIQRFLYCIVDSLSTVAWGCGPCGGTNPEGTRFCGHCGARNAAVDASITEARVGELRLVTVLFADISGFTALSERIAPDDLAEVIDPILVALGEIVDRHGGFINKYAGDAVLALFGAPVAHEDDVSRALAAALEMHREVGRLLPVLPRSAADLTLHIGVNTGHAVARSYGADARIDYSVIGDAVNAAQRIEAAAGPGETLVGERTWELGRDEFDLEPTGEIVAKGKAAPLRVFRLVGVRSAAAAPGHTAAAAAGPMLVGRHAQLVDLESVVDRLRAGDGGVLAITGDAGVGKSRVLAEVAGRRDPGIRWLSARCLSYGAGLAYWPYADLVRRWGAGGDDGVRGAGLADLGSALTHVGLSNLVEPLGWIAGIGAETGSPDKLDAEARHRVVHEAMREWLVHVAAEGPVVLALEDLHFADEASCDLTADLGGATAGAPILLIATGRPAAVDRMQAICSRAERSTSIVLGPLPSEDLAALVADELGAAVASELANQIHQRAEGNALFAIELARTLRDRDLLRLAGGHWHLVRDWDEAGVPLTVEGVLAARLDRLSRDEAAVAQSASVVGRRVPLRILRDISATTDIEEAVRGLVAAQLVDHVAEDGDDLLLFRHDLVVDVAYSRIVR